MNIDNFGIEKLHGKYNLVVKFDNNQLILVGANGTGKSTVVSILYYLITSQWTKLLDYDFSALTITINNDPIRITRDEIPSLESISNQREGMEQYSMSIEKFVIHKLNSLNITPERALQYSISKLRSLYRDVDISPSIIRRILKERVRSGVDLFDIELPYNLKKIYDQLDFSILFLPTYRRIERDLKSIFPDLEDELRSYNKRHNKLANLKRHTELVEFGMHDVRDMIDSTMENLGNNFRSSLSIVTNGYMRVILSKKYKDIDTSLLKELDKDELNDILKKIDESVLTTQERTTLRDTINQFSEDKRLEDIDKLSAHIITELVLLYKEQIKKEAKVRSFATVCNHYLTGKSFEFDSKNFTLPIKLHGEHLKSDELFSTPSDDSNNTNEHNIAENIQLSMLSSGEKQIVSLFAHLYLSGIDNYFIIIDEPELSLSVPWQRSFLPDMLKSNKCKGLVAVTHSPFIYDNELKNKAHSISEFIKGSE